MTDSLEKLEILVLPVLSPEPLKLKICYLKAISKEQTCSQSFQLCFHEMFEITFNEVNDRLSIPRAPSYQPVEGNPQRFAVTRGAGERENERSYY